MFVFKLASLYHSLMDLKNRYPEIQGDVVALYDDVETAIRTRHLSLDDARKLFADLTSLVSGFEHAWTGDRAAFDQFVLDVKAVLAGK